MRLWLLALAAPVLAADDSHPVNLVGLYIGNQAEVAAGIELHADGRFHYRLSYGALDEVAAGNWRAENGRVLLTTDPFKPPRIALVARGAETPGELHVTVEVPKGLQPGLFALAIRNAAGAVRVERIADTDMHLRWQPGDAPTTAWLVLPVLNVQSAPVTLSPDGEMLRFHFEPNEIGKADFRDAALTIDGQDLLLDRFDRHLRFHHTDTPPPPPKPRAGP
jgi:hypothetical protein